MFACIHVPSAPEGASKALQECAESFAPEAELSAPNTILFDVSRLNRLYGGLSEVAEAVARHAGSMGFEANIAIAPNAETALIAARNFPGITLIPEEAGDALAELDIENLPLTPELWQTLGAWGIRTFRDFARLPDTGLAERLGPAGVYLHRLARGAVDRPLRVVKSGGGIRGAGGSGTLAHRTRTAPVYTGAHFERSVRAAAIARDGHQ